MRLLLPLVVLAIASEARQMPEFDDELLGHLVVSKKRFPFLTPAHAPDIAHVYPTDQQLNAIKTAVGGAQQFAIRAKRAMDEDDGFPSDSNVAFGWFGQFQKFLGQFLKFEFSYEVLNSTIIDPGSLPFDKIASDAYFKAMVIRPYSTAGLATPEQEMKEFLYFKYGSASDEDFKFDKDDGGTMVYYKVTCMKVKDSYYIGLSTYDNKFTLHDIEHVDTIQSGWSFLGMSKQKTKIHRWFEKRYITLNDLKQLLDFIMRDFAERIRMKYRQYLESANIPIPKASGSRSMDYNHNDDGEFVGQSTESIIRRDVFGVDDHISHLPKLCLIEVFKYLTRKDLFNMTSVNRRMLPLYSDPALDGVKWKGCHLHVMPTSDRINNGYQFHLDIRTSDYPWNPHGLAFTYNYHVTKTVDGTINEQRYFNIHSASNIPFPSWPIPDQFFSALNVLSRQHEVETILINQVHVNEQLLTKLGTLLRGHNVRTFICDKVQYEQTTDFRKSFAQFIRKMKRVDLKSSETLGTLINDEFIAGIGESKLLEFVVTDLPPNIHDFRISQLNIMNFANLNTFEVPTMIVDANWITNLIMKHLDAEQYRQGNPQRGSWKFAVDQRVTTEIIREQLRNDDFVYKKDGINHHITRKAGSMTAIITQTSHPSGNLSRITVYFELIKNQ